MSGSGTPATRPRTTARSVPSTTTPKAGVMSRSPPVRREPEESRSDLQAEGIDEEDEAETFGEVEHLTVDAQAQVPGDDADEATA